MSKHTYGFPAGTDKVQAIESAKQQAVDDGYISGPDACGAEVLETDAHRDNGEYVVVIRTLGQGALG